ncbi:hypothetical protein ACO22_01496 [Paracoccidioides brasiliensis]|uniref:Uncharacterized protein n=1 Tax=Paracoccidioides brasiliensis TaxID=121759 RepID=A0A1D2JLA9_PARBR|nr:hypothetical protein ACO22_01496 [Paracoccidioides brasiliensis]ODH49512.1 hypothetical protein GX48_04299 [Paracoccidioides brasiliensis]
MSAKAIQYLLPFTFIFAIYAIAIFGQQNGFLGMLDQNVENGTLPETDERLRTTFTGVHAVDHLLTTLVSFFWPVVDGSSPSLSLHGLNFAGALGALWVLILLESFRPGNKARLVLYPVIFGLLFQLITLGIAIPIYAALHLYTSRTLSNPTRQTVTIRPSSLTGVKLIPFSVTLGYLLPSIFLTLPESTWLPLQSTQERIAFWQPWPIWVWLIHSATTRITTALLRSNRALSAKQTLSTLRCVYAFAFALAAVSHIATWSLSFTTMIFPILFARDFAAALHPARVFLNTMPWSGARAKSCGESVLWILQWDQLLGTGCLLLWAISLYVAAHQARKLSVGCIGLGVKVAWLCAVSGVAGAVVELMWERDELVLQGQPEEQGAQSEPGKSNKR